MSEQTETVMASNPLRRMESRIWLSRPNLGCAVIQRKVDWLFFLIRYKRLYVKSKLISNQLASLYRGCRNHFRCCGIVPDVLLPCITTGYKGWLIQERIKCYGAGWNTTQMAKIHGVTTTVIPVILNYYTKRKKRWVPRYNRSLRCKLPLHVSTSCHNWQPTA
jgi:hypothetical protein